MTTEFYGLLAQQLSGLEPATEDLDCEPRLSEVAARWTLPVAQLSEMIERTHLMSTQIGMNVQPGNLLGAWLMDLTISAKADRFCGGLLKRLQPAAPAGVTPGRRNDRAENRGGGSARTQQRFALNLKSLRR